MSEPDLAVARYIATSIATLHRALADAMPALAEPPEAAWDCAWPRLNLLVEAQVGVASGLVIGRIATAIVQTFGSELDARFATVLRGELAGLQSSRAAPGAATSRAPYLADAALRPLADELGSQLHVRFVHACGQARTALTAIANAVPARRAADVERILELRAGDGILRLQITEHVLTGWAAYRASLAGLEPVLPGGVVGELWRAWLRRVRGEVAAAEPRRDIIIAIA